MFIEHTTNGDVDGVLDMLFKAKSIKGFVDTADETTYSALHHAAFRGLTSIAVVLVDAGANVLAVDRFGKTPAHLAIQKGHTQLALYLIGLRHPMEYPKGAKLTLMQMASLCGHNDVIKNLVTRGISVNER